MNTKPTPASVLRHVKNILNRTNPRAQGPDDRITDLALAICDLCRYLDEDRSDD